MGTDRRIAEVEEHSPEPDLVRAAQLVLLGDPLERFGGALDPVGQAIIAFDRQLANNLVLAPRRVVSKLRVVIDVLASGVFVAHSRPRGLPSLVRRRWMDQSKTPGIAGRSLEKIETKSGVL